MLARHAIGWSFVPPALTESLPTTIADARLYIERAENQQAQLLMPLGVDPHYLKAFGEHGGHYEDFFEAQRGMYPWYAEDAYRRFVIRDAVVINDGLRRLRKIVDLWTADETSPASDYALTPFSSAVALNNSFRALSVFAQDLLGTFGACPMTGIQKFYDQEERNRRDLVTREFRRSLPPSTPPSNRRLDGDSV